MFRTMPRAGALVALAALLGDSSLRAAPATTGSDQPYSIVAQSTSATAATGRRPIGKRIAASNLPVRAAPPPPLPKCPDEVAMAKAVVAPIPADPPLPDEPDPLVDAETAVDAETPVVAEPPATRTVQTAEPSEQIPAVPAASDTDPAPEPAATVELVHSAGGTEAAPVPVVHARPALPPAARENLLNRIKTAFGVQHRNGRPAPTTAPAEPAAAMAPVPAPAAAPAMLAAGEPARLEFDVRESRSLMSEGEQVVMRIAVRNIGGETAERVTATLFFAEGIEPVQAIGRAAEVYPGEVRFETVPQLSPGDSVDLLVTAVGTRAGSVAYRGEIECREPAGRVAREGTVTIQARQASTP